MVKHLALRYAVVAAAFLTLWFVIVAVEVRFGALDVLKYIFFVSLLAVPVAFFAAGIFGLRASASARGAGTAMLGSLVLSPLFIVVGVIVAVNFKFLLGGSL